MRRPGAGPLGRRLGGARYGPGGGGGAALAVAVDGFADTGSGSYFGHDDASQFQAVDTYTIVTWFIINSLEGATRSIAQKGAGTSSGWRTMLDGSEQLRARDSGLTAELYATTAFDAGDIGKCVLTVFTRDNTEGGQLYLWSDAIAAAALQQTTTAASPTVTAAAEMAIGAKRGDTGADEAEGLGIVGVAYGTTWLSQAAATTYMAQCVAELTVSATLPGVVGCWQAATDHADSLGRDVVGAEHFTKKEETPGDLDADQFFVPDWIDLPSSFGPSFGSSFGI